MPSEEANEGSRLSPVSRRAVLGGLSLLPLAAAMRGALPAASADPGYRFLTPHQAAVLDAATRRLVPGPEDCPLEVGRPGAHEANVVNFLDRMLSVFDVTPADVHAGGPWSNRAGGSQDFMATFVPLNRAQTYAWQRRLTQLRDQYTSGIALLDQLAGGDFTAVKPVRQDSILVYGQAVTFTSLLFGHTIEAMYSNPEYGGNANLVGWKGIKYPGDSQPRGYTPEEVEGAQWDLVVVTDIIDRVRHGWEQLVAKLGGKGGTGAGS
ncbi:MAG TPA: gluconate 2-dehydrogenase subunit 3 family protein [Mycobacterium sp.]|nr:gluconate 2-dehydrogenase subunit 3 family protein [Mycobacterium sp.]